MDAVESPNATSESGTLSPAHFGHSRKRKHSGSTDRPTREYGLMRDTGKHDTARFVGSGSGIHFIRGVYVRLARKSALRSQSSTNINDLVPGEDDQLQRETSSRDGDDLSLWKPHELAPEGDGSGDDVHPSFEQLVEWSKSYFEAWHPTLPFLSAPDVLTLFEQVSAAGIATLRHLERSIVQSILSISLADSRQRAPFTHPVPASLVFRTVEEAMSASQFALYQPASVQATQAALAIQLFLTSMLRLNSASRLGGLIVRMAFHLGLHRCPSRYPFFTKDEAHMRRRVFWCIYSTERFLCQALGLPLDIRDDDVDVCYPGEERHGTAIDGDDGRLQLLTYLVKHARIRGLILELRNKSITARDDTADRASYVQAELAKWSNEIHDAVEDEHPTADGDDAAPQPPISAGHRIFLLLLKYESMISLNRPMMTSDPSSPAYSAGLQNCIFAAKSIFMALRRFITQNKIPSDASSARLRDALLQPSFTWAVWISAFILIYAAFERQLPLSSALRHVESGKDVLRHIASRDTSWPEYCLSAVDELTAAVRELSGPHNPLLRRRTSAPVPTSSVQPRSGDHGSLPRSGSSPNRSRNMPSDSASTHLRTTFSPSVAASSGRPDEHVHPPADGAPWTHNHRCENFPPPEEQAGRWPAQASPTPASLGAAWSAGTPGPQPGFQAAAQNNSPNFENPPFPVAMGQTPFAGVGGAEGATGVPGEGQESMVWYDQLFANSFGAIDYPFLAAAQFDPSVDPTWSYLR
ncbi:Transcriptional activator protein acu-15 [Colletotrichum sidae]|uniref:Transcriptional activator protein acu-15 n=1 Tax=Colletotrichum sidae TaxID=1347389 RepID=A0A4R8TTE6_9PEZI|nr:Transcriptional activator protein acu-15 [Colletotrichum sidae]